MTQLGLENGAETPSGIALGWFESKLRAGVLRRRKIFGKGYVQE
jgi:hypothetical protein